MPRKLRVWTDDTDLVIAQTAAQARRLLMRANNLCDNEVLPVAEWNALPDGDDFTFFDGADGTRTKTVAEWCREHGPGYFACYEY
jgi:hypothetical protein